MKIFELTLCLWAIVLSGEAQQAPVWSSIYSVRGNLIIPYAELVEPFYAWYDGTNQQSRIDYYGGMVKTYQLTKQTDFGISLKVAPVTTEEELNAKTCLQVNGTEEMKIQPQTVLPELTGFKMIGEDQINGVETEKWQMTNQYGAKVNKYTMWLRYETDLGAKKIPIPVRYEMKGFNSLLGSHYDHYYLDYTDFTTDDIDGEVFKVDPKMACVGFPGPGAKHVYTFNPMREFIHPHYEEHLNLEFERFINKHGKDYQNVTEHAKRKEVFRQNVRFVYSKNRANLGYSLGINHLSDQTDLEVAALRGKQYSPGYNGGKEFPYSRKALQGILSNVPESFDWRLFGAVTPVKDQSVCGSCWSFGTVGAIEGAYFLKTKQLVRLSQQALIDCTWGYGNNGCDGGEDFRVYQWMMKHGGIPSEEDYGPYLGQDGYCHVKDVALMAPIKGFVNVTSNDVDAMRLAIFKHGPISVAIDASHKTFSFYSNGVYYEPKCGNREDQLDHAVLAVGYGVINGSPYWLVKNSWSTHWGNDGYILMSAKDNNCGVMTTPTYVEM